MKVTEFSVKQSTTVWVLIFVIFLGGMMSYFSLPREAAPDIAIPVVIVSTPYFGVSPSDIERLVTDPMEKELKGLRNVKRMTSTSAESVSLVTVEFQPDVIIEDALQKVRDKVDKAKPELPPDAEDPEIIEVNASDWPVLIANVSGKMDPVRLKEFAEDIKDEIEKQPGVLRVDVAGGVEREIQILVDAPKIRYHGISLSQIINKLQAENVNLPGGNIDLGSMKYTVRVPGEFSNVADIEDIVIKAPDGVPVYLRDVAVVKDGFKERSTLSRLTTWSSEGTETLTQANVSLSIVKRSGENIIHVAEASKTVIESFVARAPEGVEILIINDMSEVIQAQVHDLENNIISGLILVFLVLLFFMGGARNALFVAVSVPLSMLISFLVLSMLGITLNMVVLFSLILALGMLVDNAIVIVENIYRHASEGKSRVRAALDGTAEVGWAVVASTATTVAAFFPMVFWPGVTGEFMAYLPKTVIITLLASLFVALVINPTLCATFMKVKPNATTNERETPNNVVYRVYANLLDWSLKYTWLVVIAAFVALVGTFMIFGNAGLGVEFFPPNTPDRFQVAVEMPDGTNLETTDELVNRIEGMVGGDRDLVEAWIGDTGVKGGGGGFAAAGSAPHFGRVVVDLVDLEDQKSDPYEFMAELRKVFTKIPGATITLEVEGMGPPAGAPVNIEIVGDDLNVLASLARQVKDEIRSIPGLIDLRDNVELARPEVHVTVDRERAAVAGVDTRSVAQTVRTAINGTEATVFRDGEDEYDVVVRLPEFERDSIEDLASLTVVNRDDLHIPITEVADIGERGGAGSIRHKNQDRVVTVSANNADGFLAANLLIEAQKRVDKLPVPPGYTIRYTGENEDQDEAAGFLGGALLAALFLILLILVTEFNSLAQPVIILFSVILSLIGVLWSLMIFQMPFGIIMTGIGVISLAGVVVNNAIVMIDYANQVREKDGLSYREAVRIAAMVRFRPVLLTATTTILGLLPLVVGISIDFVNTTIVFGGRSVEMWGPMARVVSFGLLVATILTLVVVPALYTIFGNIGERVKRLTRPAAAITALFLVAAIPWTSYAQQPESTDAAAETAAADAEPTFEARPDSETELRVKNTMADDVGAKRTLTLLQAQEMLEKQNFDLNAARARIKAADARIRQAYSTVFPTFTAAGQFIVNQKEITADFGDAPPGTPAAEPIIIQPKTSWQWSLAASIRLNLRAMVLVDTAYLERDITKLRVGAIRFSLDTALIEAYYSLLTIRSVMQISMEQVESAQTVLNVAEKRRAAGTATDFEVTRANLRLVQAQQDVERSKLNFQRVRESLAELIDTEADFDVETPVVRTEVMDLNQAKQNALENQDSIRIARLSTELASELITDTYYKYLPVFGATFRLAQQKGTALSASDPRWTLVFSGEWTLWDGGFREAELRERKAEKIALEFEQRKQERQSATEIDRTYAEYLSAVNQLESRENQLRLAQEALRQAQTAYKYGVATQLDLINAEDQLKLAKLSNLQDKLAIELAITKLDHLGN